MNPPKVTMSNARLGRISLVIATCACLGANILGFFHGGILVEMLIGTLCSIGIINILIYAWDAIDGMSLILTGKDIFGESPKRSGTAKSEGWFKIGAFATIVVISLSIAFLTSLASYGEKENVVLYTWFLGSGVFFLSSLFLQGRTIPLDRG